MYVLYHFVLCLFLYTHSIFSVPFNIPHNHTMLIFIANVHTLTQINTLGVKYVFLGGSPTLAQSLSETYTGTACVATWGSNHRPIDYW